MSLRNLIRKVLKEQSEEEVRIEPEEFKQLMKYVNGDSRLLKRLKQYKDKKIIIDGDLEINKEDNVSNIDAIDYVDGSLDINYSDIPYFDKSKVKGNFKYYYSKMWEIERKKIYEQKIAYQEKLRQDDTWNVNNNDEVSNQTEALFEHLKSEGIVKEGDDKYDSYKNNYNYKGGTGYYTWLGDEEFESEWIVYNENDIHDAAVESLQNLVDDIGLDAFRSWVWDNHIDEDHARSFLYDDFEYPVREEPENYNVKKELSSEQERTIEAFKNKISNVEKKLQDTSLGEEEVNRLQNSIYSAQQIIEDIEDNPEGDYDEDDIERAINDMVDNNIDDIIDLLKNRGYDKDFILDFYDVDAVIEDVIRADGYGHTLNSYDGREDEYKVNGTWYYVMRQN